MKDSAGSTTEISAKRIFINAGARPARPGLNGLNGVEALDSTSVMELAAVPEHLLVLGELTGVTYHLPGEAAA